MDETVELEKLDRCPFCGSSRLDDYFVRDGRRVACKCGASMIRYHGKSGNTRADVRAAWNRRADDARSSGPVGDREEMAESAAEKFVRRIARLSHSGDDGYTHPDDPDDDHYALDRLIAEAREVDLQPLRGVLAEALPRQQAVPDGWVIVPREPTEEMIDAYFDRCRDLGFTAHINASAAWEAMLSAAPPVPTDQEGEKGASGGRRALADALQGRLAMSAQLTLTDREMFALLRCDIFHGGPDIEAAKSAARKLRKALDRPSRRQTTEHIEENP